jgi:hypothetical protein
MKSQTTGYQNPNCYLKYKSDCCETTSGEHYISEGILKQIHPGEKSILVSGLPRQPKGDIKPVGIANLKGRCLCKRHNERLTDLDANAINFFEALDGYARRQGDEEFYLDGALLERWILKALIGRIASKTTPSVKEIPAEALPLMLGETKSWPVRSGLYILHEQVKLIGTLASTISYGPLGHSTMGVFGDYYKTNGFVMHCPFLTPPPEIRGAYRPERLILRQPNRTAVIHLDWDGLPCGPEYVDHWKLAGSDDSHGEWYGSSFGIGPFGPTAR